jgi:hypothetical protein
MQLGNAATVIATSGGYTVVSDGRFKQNIEAKNVPGLDFINKLRPVTYTFNYKTYDDFLRKNNKEKVADNEYQNELIKKNEIRQAGFIAQEVEQV